DRAMEAQRDRGRGAQRFSDAQAAPELVAASGTVTRFLGDRAYTGESTILALLEGGRETRGPVREGAAVEGITAETPFYAESGGQVGDGGAIETRAGARVEIEDTHYVAPGVVGHRGVVRTGAISVGETVRLAIDVARRDAARLNHSATHLMHG